MHDLNQLTLNECVFNRDRVAALGRSQPELSISANGAVALGIAGDATAEGPHVQIPGPKSAAKKASIRVNDLILSADGLTVKNHGDLSLVESQKKDGDVIPVKLRRGKQTLTVNVRLCSPDLFLQDIPF